MDFAPQRPAGGFAQPRGAQNPMKISSARFTSDIRRRCASSSRALALGLCVFFCAVLAHGASSICAKARIEISQEVAFERQAFEARMTIYNNVPGASLSEISATIFFRNQAGDPVSFTVNPNETDAALKFFVKVPQAPSSIASGANQTLTWQIIPTSGAGGADSAGVVYFAGATLSYKALGRTEIVEVEPDFIFVKPQPSLRLDYFLTREIFGDDLLTPQIEAVEPYFLGLRVQNAGKGAANALTISSGQPRIVENSQNLAVSFTIKEAFVNDQAVSPQIQVPIGSVQPNAAASVAWKLETAVYGRVTSFSASYSHSDDLGGKVTSLIQNVATHNLLGMVVVDRSGRDSIRDFLAADNEGNGTVSVFESNGQTASIPNPSIISGLPLNGGGTRRSISAQLPPLSGEGFVYLKSVLPGDVPSDLRRVVRSDGKVLPSSNAWVSKRRVSPGDYERSLNVFDTGAAGGLSYEIEFGLPLSTNQPPILMPLRSYSVRPGTPVQFAVRATDPDGGPPQVSAAALPSGAVFPPGNGSGIFSWTPGQTQLGAYVLTFFARDTTSQTQSSMVLTVTTASLLDEWKKRWFGSQTDPNVVANWADPDADGLSNLLEYALDLDPTSSSIDRKPVVGRMKVGNKNYLTLTYVHRVEDAALTLQTIGTGEIKLDENQWVVQTTNIPAAQEDIPPGMQRTTFRDSVALEDSGFRFLRLKVSIAQ